MLRVSSYHDRIIVKKTRKVTRSLRRPFSIISSINDEIDHLLKRVLEL